MWFLILWLKLLALLPVPQSTVQCAIINYLSSGHMIFKIVLLTKLRVLKVGLFLGIILCIYDMYIKHRRLMISTSYLAGSLLVSWREEGLS